MYDSSLVGIHRLKGDGALVSYSLCRGLSCVSAKAGFAFAAVVVNVENYSYVAALASVRNEGRKVLHGVEVVPSSSDDGAHILAGELEDYHSVLLRIADLGVPVTERHENFFDVAGGGGAFELKNLGSEGLCLLLLFLYLFGNGSFLLYFLFGLFLLLRLFGFFFFLFVLFRLGSCFLGFGLGRLFLLRLFRSGFLFRGSELVFVFLLESNLYLCGNGFKS